MPTEQAILTSVRGFLLEATGNTLEVVQGQVNRVPEPESDTFVVFWPAGRHRLSTNRNTYDTLDNLREITTPMELIVQADVHGATSSAADIAQDIYSLWRDPFACSVLGDVAQPLFCEDPVQMPFANGEKQTENRWVLRLHLQANMTVSTPQDFADSLAFELVEVDTTYPPGAS